MYITSSKLYKSLPLIKFEFTYEFFFVIDKKD